MAKMVGWPHHIVRSCTGALILAVLLGGCSDSETPTAPPGPLSAKIASPGLRWDAISAGFRFTCGIASSILGSNRAYCWGSNTWGQLGIGPSFIGPIKPPYPVAVDAADSLDANHPGQFVSFDYFTTIATGSDFACGLGYTGSPSLSENVGGLWCWGLNDAGQLGINSIGFAIDPQFVQGGELFKEASVGAYAVCGSKRFNASGPGFGTFCWGRTAFGQAGDGGTQYDAYTEPTEMVGLHTFDSLAHGWGHVCGLSQQLYCWGFNSAGQVGDGTHQDRASATLIAGAPAFVALTAGTYHTCGLTSQGEAFCWGGNDNGQLGMGTYGGDRTVPTALPTKLRFTIITAGAFHTCAITKTGAAHCWGYGGTGELGDGTFNSKNTPTAVAGGQKFSSISAGDDGHTCAITASKVHYLFCWGNNDSGQLGIGVVGGNLAVPTRVVDGP